jgi:hypothetical protein
MLVEKIGAAEETLGGLWDEVDADGIEMNEGASDGRLFAYRVDDDEDDEGRCWWPCWWLW